MEFRNQKTCDTREQIENIDDTIETKKKNEIKAEERRVVEGIRDDSKAQ